MAHRFHKKHCEGEILVAFSQRFCISKGHSSDLALSIYVKNSQD